MIKYNFYSSSVIGSGHIDVGLPCQDSSNALERNNVFFVIVCDGCGSKKHSDKGSKIISECLPTYVCDNFDSIYEKDEEQIKQELVLHVIKNVTNYGVENDISPDEMLSTFLFAAVKENKYILCRCGDGAIIATFKDGSYAVLEEEKTGSAERTTYFNNPSCLSKMDLGKGDDTLEGAFIFTDGFNNDADVDEESAKILIKKIKSATKLTSEEIKEQIDKQIVKQIKETSDDCSIAIIAIDNKTETEVKKQIKEKKDDVSKEEVTEKPEPVSEPTKETPETKVNQRKKDNLIKLTKKEFKKIFKTKKKWTPKY